jgi:hypothetical protein
MIVHRTAIVGHTEAGLVGPNQHSVREVGEHPGLMDRQRGKRMGVFLIGFDNFAAYTSALVLERCCRM